MGVWWAPLPNSWPIETCSAPRNRSDTIIGMSSRTASVARVCGIVSLVCVSACGLFSKADEKPAAQAAPIVVADDWPKTPVAAFRPAAAGICPEGYALVQTTCVHTAFRSRTSPTELDRQLAAYRAGAASPRVGGGPAPTELPEPVAALDPDDPANLPPDAFTKKRLDPEAVKAKRLQELETLIRNAKIRAGEKVDDDPAAPAGVDMMNPASQRAAQRKGETAKLNEMTEGLPPDVLKAVLVEIERNGGTAMVSLEELKALEAQAKKAEAEGK